MRLLRLGDKVMFKDPTHKYFRSTPYTIIAIESYSKTQDPESMLAKLDGLNGSYFCGRFKLVNIVQKKFNGRNIWT